MAILGTMPVMTAPRPLYSARGDSRFTISAPVVMKPRRFAPGARARRESCMRTLIVSSGWQARASIMPAPPPAMRFVAAEAGFLPAGPAVDFADMVWNVELLSVSCNGGWCSSPGYSSLHSSSSLEELSVSSFFSQSNQAPRLYNGRHSEYIDDRDSQRNRARRNKRPGREAGSANL